MRFKIGEFNSLILKALNGVVVEYPASITLHGNSIRLQSKDLGRVIMIIADESRAQSGRVGFHWDVFSDFSSEEFCEILERAYSENHFQIFLHPAA